MSEILLKIYAGFSPAPEELEALLEELRPMVIGEENYYERDGDILNISYEGIYFPVDELKEILEKNLAADSQGRLDVLDIEGWTLTRHVWEKTEFKSSPPRDLNHIMDYSGF